jgi:hypothetical protein
MAKGDKAGGGGYATKERPRAAVGPAEEALDFEENGAAADAWGAPRYQEWWDSLNPDEQRALRMYQDMTHGSINHYLREGTAHQPYTEAQLQGMIKDLDRALARGRLGRDVTVYRGVYSARVVYGTTPEGLVGRTIHDKGFHSTSLSRKIAQEDFAGRHPEAVTFRIQVPKGSKGGYLGSLGSRDMVHEREFLLPRGQKYRVTKVTKTSKGYIADAELL